MTAPRKLQLRRGNSTATSTYVGAPGELIINTDNSTLYVHDGVTVGGHAATVNTVSLTNAIASAEANIILANTIQASQITTANTGIKGYVDLANSIQSAQITSANLGIIGYINQSNTIQSAQVGAANLAITAANVGIKGYVDNAVSTANIGIKGYIDQGNTIQASAITAANLGMKGYVDSVSGGSSYGNANVKVYLSTFDGNILPSANVTYSLGSPTRQWKDLFVSNNTIYLGGVPMSIDASGSLTVAGNVVAGTNLVTYGSNVSASAVTLSGPTGQVGNVKVLTPGSGFTMFMFYATTSGSGTGLSFVAQGSTIFDPVAFNARGTGYRVGDVITIVNDITGPGYSDATVVVTELLGIVSPGIYVGNTAYKFGADGNIRLPAGGGILDSTGASVLGTGGTNYSNTNVAAYTTTQGYTNYSNVNVSALITTNGLTNYSNVNVAAYVTTSNTGIIGYIDQANTIQSAQVGAANLAITAANVGMRGYVDSQSFYSNAKVATYLPTYSGNISANISKAGYTWTFGTTGTLTVPASGTITAPIAQEFQLQAKDANSVLRNEINLDPNNGTYMSVWSDQTTSFSSADWYSGSWNNESGLGAARFTDAQTLQDFWTTGNGSLGLAYEVSINGGARSPNVFYDGNNGETYGVFLGVDPVPPGGPGTTVPITSLVFYYRTQSKINIDVNGSEILLDAQSMDLDLRTTNNLDLRANQNLNLRGLGAYPVRIYTNGTTHKWEFDNTGSLTLPREGKIYGVGDGVAAGDRLGYISWAGNSSGDGSGYNTMRLVPDLTGLEAADQYIIIDPTGGVPGHIHIRAGGTQDNSGAHLYLGGEHSHVKISAGLNPPVTVMANDNAWTFGTDGNLTLPNVASVSINYANGVSILSGLGSGGGGNYGNIDVKAYLATGDGVSRFIQGYYANLDLGATARLYSYGSSAASFFGHDGFANVNINYVRAGQGDIQIATNNGDHNWTFSNAGNLTLPAGGRILESTYLSADSIILKPNGGTSTQYLEIAPTAVDGNHVHLMTGSGTELFLGDDNHYVKLANTGGVVINSNDGIGNTAQWTFGKTGTTQFPGDIILAPAGQSITMQSDNYSQLMWENANLTVAPNMAINSNFYVAQNNATLDIGYRDGSSTQLIKSWYWNVDGNLKLPSGGYILNSDDSIYGGSSYSNIQVATYLPAYSGVVTASNVAVAGNVTAQYLFGNGSQLTGIVAGSSYSNVQVATYLPTYAGTVSASLVNSSGNVLSTGLSVFGNTRIGLAGAVSGQFHSVVGNITQTSSGGAVYINTTGNVLAAAVVAGAVTSTGTVAVNAATGITTNQATFLLANATATTINMGGAATTINLGSTASATGNVFVGGQIGSNAYNLTLRANGRYNVATSINSNGGFNSPPYANQLVIGGTGTGMTANYSATGGYIDSLTIYNSGTGYRNGDVISVPGGIAGNSFVLQNYSSGRVGAFTGTALYTFGIDGNLIVPGNVSATTFVGSGALLTSLPGYAYGNVNVAAYLNATGYNLYSNVNVANYLTTATITTTGNVTAGNLITGGALYVANITTTGASGNISGANYITANVILTNGGWGNISQVALITANVVTATSYIKITPTTVANLISASTVGAGARDFVTDANTITFGSVVGGSGANNMPVFSNGTSWLIG